MRFTCHALSHYFALLYIALHSKPYRPFMHFTCGPLRYIPCPGYMRFWGLGIQMLCPHCMQSWTLRGIGQATITCNFWAATRYVMLSSYSILELMGHMPCHHYMQFWSIYCMCTAIIKCNFWACWIYIMPRTITSYCVVLLNATLNGFTPHCNLSFIVPMCHTFKGHETICDASAICSSWACMGICHALNTCNSGAGKVSPMPPSHVICDHLGHVQCPHWI